MVTAVRIIARRPLVYRRGADPALDRPAYVRAASAIAWIGEHLVCVQDDAAFLAIVDPATGVCDDIALPVDVGGRRIFDATIGNKADKPDLESMFAAGDLMIALGSGGPKPARRVAVTWRPGEAPRRIAVPRLFDAIGAALLPDGTSLNLEGALLDGDDVVIANRGGDRCDDRVSPDALVRLPLAALRALIADPDGAPVPPLQVERRQLGVLDGAPLHFSDLAPSPAGALFLAVAEATTSYFDDGVVTGSVVGTLADGRWAPICAGHGAVAIDKVEGVCAGAQPGELFAVTDPDDPSRPGELLTLAITP